MNVRCPDCNTEFVLDDAQVPAGGLQVQCSSCSAVFNAVHDNPNLPPASGDAEWMVRQPNGSVYRLRELTTLQRWIVERKVTRDDEISRSGQKWERLGNIAELAAFFQVVDASLQAASLAQPIAPAPSPVPAPTSVPVPAPPVAGDPDGAPGGSIGNVYEREPAWESSPQQLPSPNPTGTWEMQSSGQDLDHLYEEDDDDLDFRPPRRGRWVAVVFLMLVGAGFATWYTAPEWVQRQIDAAFGDTLGETSPALLQEIVAAEEKAKPDTAAAFDAADDALAALASKHPAADAVTRAQAELALARVHHARRHWDIAADTPERDEGEQRAASANPAALADAEVEGLLAKAGTALELMSESGTSSEALQRALADYYRLRGDPQAAKTALAQGRLGSNSNDARLRMVEGELNDDPAALEAAARAGWVRAQVDLAAMHYDSGESERARDAVEVIAEHPTARAILALLNRSAEASETETESKKESSAPDFSRLLAMADRARRADRTVRALKLYEKALDMKPEDVEALAGTGWAYIDLGNGPAATATFERVLSKNDRFSDAHMGLAEAFNLRGMKRDAIKHYQRYLELLPNGSEASVAKRMIEKLGQ